MKISAKQLLIPITLAVMLSAPAMYAQSAEAPPNSAKSSQVSATRADETQRIVDSCAAAADELAAVRRLAATLERENSMLTRRLETEIKRSALSSELLETRRAESAALREVVASKDEVIRSRGEVIAAQDRMITELKGTRRSPWQRVGDVLIGIAAGALIR